MLYTILQRLFSNAAKPAHNAAWCCHAKGEGYNAGPSWLAYRNGRRLLACGSGFGRLHDILCRRGCVHNSDILQSCSGGRLVCAISSICPGNRPCSREGCTLLYGHNLDSNLHCGATVSAWQPAGLPSAGMSSQTAKDAPADTLVRLDQAPTQVFTGDAQHHHSAR